MDKCRERMKAAIDKYGYTYEQLEGLTGVAKSSIQRYIVGETEKIPVDFVAKLANITNTSASYLAGFEDKETILHDVRRGCDNAMIEKVIVTKSLTGSGTAANPYREIVQYWSLDGEFLFSKE